MKYSKTLFSLFAVLQVITFVRADEETGGRDLSGYEPSYFVYAVDDDNHIEFKVSIKYPLLDRSDTESNLFFSYTGKYDFFVISDDPSRESAPVISRLQNPGLFFKIMNKSDAIPSLVYYSIGWFHESNGQQIADYQTFANTPNASDFVSRGWDYAGIDLKFRQEPLWALPAGLVYYLRFRFIADCQALCLIKDKEDDIRVFGGTEQADIRDYDGLRFIARYDKWPFSLALNLRSGISDSDALSNLSYQVDMSYRILNMPVTFFYFNGYGKDISTYHIKDHYVGIGFEFW